MKKSLIIIALTLFSVVSFAQTKTPDQKPKYQKFVKIEVSDMTNFIQSLEQWKRLVIYDPKATPDDKVRTIQNLDGYILQLTTRVKVDSLRTDSVKVAPPSKKK